MAELEDGHGCVFDLLGALPAHALTLSALRENAFFDHVVTVLQGVTVFIACTGRVDPTVTNLAFRACAVGTARATVVHARGAIPVVVAVVRVEALLADTLSTAHQAVVAAVFRCQTTRSIIKHFVVITASFARGGIAGAVQAIVWAAGAGTGFEGVAIFAFLTISIKVAHTAVADGAHGAKVVGVHVVAVSALFARVAVLRGVVSCLLEQAHLASLEVAVNAVAIVVLVVSGSALEAAAVHVAVTVGAVHASGKVTLLANSVGAAVFSTFAAIRRPFVTVSVVASATAVTLVVVQHVDVAEVEVPSVWQSNAVAVVLGLVVALLAFHAICLLEAVLAVVEI